MSLEDAINALAPPKCDRTYVTVRTELALSKLVEDRSHRDLARNGDRRKLKQAVAAIVKLAGLLEDEKLRNAFGHGFQTVASKAPELVDTVSKPFGDALPTLAGLKASIETVLEQGFDFDTREDRPLREFIAELGRIFLHSIGPVDLPSYNDGTGEITGRFFSYARLALIHGLGKQAPTDEALRHRIRDAIGLGEIPQKISARRLYQYPADASSEAVTKRESSEVTKHEQAAGGPRRDT